MTGHDATVTDFWTVTVLAFAIAAVVMTATALLARRIGRVSVVDVAWGIGLVGVALGCALLAGTWQSWLLCVLVTLWGGRLSWHIFRRSRGQGEDPRYRELLGGTLAEVGFGVAVRKVFLVQGVAVWFVALPLQAAAIWGPAGRCWCGSARRSGWSASSSSRSVTPSSRRTSVTPTAGR